MSDIKAQLFLLCGRYINQRAEVIKQNLAEAREAANNDEKNNTGDKFEAGPEMMQQEIELNLGRLGEILKLQQALENISPSNKSSVVQPGALVYTTNGNYYISIGAGKLTHAGQNFFAVSPDAPVAVQMNGKKAGDSFQMNGRTITIERIE